MKQFLWGICGTVITLLLLSMPAMAVGLEYYGIEDHIRSDMTVLNSVTLKFDSPISHLEYQLDFRAYNLTASSNFQSSCEIADRNGKSSIVCDFAGMPLDNLLKLDFVSKDGVVKSGNEYKFTVNYGISLPIKRVFVIIALPEKAVFSREPVNASYFPGDGEIMTDGKHIMVYWEKENLNSGDDLKFSTFYGMPAAFDVTGLFVLLGPIGGGIIIVAVGLGYVMLKRVPKSREILHSVLNSDEKRIMDVLHSREGRCGQKILVRETDFSKAKVSRLIKNLRDRGVIKIEPISGRENRIVLKTSFTEKKEKEGTQS